MSSTMQSENGSISLEDPNSCGTINPSRVERTIGNRERAMHFAFAKSRKEDFVYAPTKHYLQILNDYCQWDNVARSALLVVVGQPGVGKSALLANWAKERRCSIDGDREFIYEHYSGCSFDSVKLSSFLFRFMNQLKISYSLRDFELPHEHEEEKLRFSFSRCLEAATGEREHKSGSGSKRKRIILVLDGIDCIRNEDGGENLSWLPNSFPADVRIIASATQINPSSNLHCSQTFTRLPVVYDSDGDLIYDFELPQCDEESHTIRELRRRKAAFMLVESLDEVSCLAILKAYEQKFSVTLDPEVKQLAVGASGSSNPLYVRLLLNGHELFGPGKRDQRRQWLDQASKSNQVNTVFELLMKQWNVILSTDMFAEGKAMLDTTSACTDQYLSTSNRGQSSAKGTFIDLKNDHISLSGTVSKSSLLSSHQNHENIPSLQTTMKQYSLLIRHTLSLLAVCRFGLSENDLMKLLGASASRSVCQQLLILLKPHLMTIYRLDCGPNSLPQSIGALDVNIASKCGNFKNGGEGILLYGLSHNQLRLLARYGFLNDEHIRICYYRELAIYFEAMEVCQRRVDELPVQLERCSMWGVLQNSLVNMNMFQLWWSERNRQDFFFYWTVISLNCSMHDPVEDFIRSLDEYIFKEAPNAELMLSLILTITDFLRAWQKINASRIAYPVLIRPKPPQLQNFLRSLDSLLTSSIPEIEVKIDQKETNTLFNHQDDGYYLRRWLWVQFPLIATALESRICRCSVLSQVSAISASSSSLSFGEDTVSTVLSGYADRSTSIKFAPAVVKKTHQLPVSVILPQGFEKLKKCLFSSKRQPLFKILPSPGSQNFANAEMGALKFLSLENSEDSLCSVSKLESLLMDIRMKYDKIKFVALEKNEALRAIESRLMDAKTKATALCQSATQTDDLLETILNVNDDATRGRQRSKYYKLILRQCELNPARDPKTIETAEAIVGKIKYRIMELQQKSQAVTYEKRLASLDVPKLIKVTRNKAIIHQEALSRLRWRLELDQRLSYARLTARNGQLTVTSNAFDSPHLSNIEKDSKVTKDEAIQILSLDSEKIRAKDETSRARQETVEDLQLDEGCFYKDDGIFGALRQVGININKPDDILLCWQNQRDHSAQLEAEEKQAEQRVLKTRRKLKFLQAQLINLKLSGSFNVQDDGSFEDDAADVHVKDGAADLKKSIDLKMLEKQLSEGNAVKQMSKERVARLRSLQDKLQLGLLHIAQLLGVTSVHQLDAVELVDSIEKILRVVSGGEAHLQAVSPIFRHKNSFRMFNTTSQPKDLTKVSSDTRTDGDKVRLNIRVSHTAKRQINPYIDAAFSNDDEEKDEEDQEDKQMVGADNDRYGSHCRAHEFSRKLNTVRKRQDIKKCSKLELKKIHTAQKKSKD